MGRGQSVELSWEPEGLSRIHARDTLTSTAQVPEGNCSHMEQQFSQNITRHLVIRLLPLPSLPTHWLAHFTSRKPYFLPFYLG